MTSAGDCTAISTRTPIPARHQYPDDLIEGLPACEWPYLRDRLIQHCFHYDVLGKLPLELAMCVVAYLDPLDVVALRRVSKRWHSLLTSDEVSRQVYLKCWLQEDLPETKNWTGYLDQRLCCEHALACGRPWSKADFVDSTLHVAPNSISQAPLHGSHFSWCATGLSHDSQEHIAVLSLSTGSVSRYFPATRSRLISETIVISDVLVGCLSRDGNCEIFEMLNGTCHSFRLPSAAYKKLILQGDKIACINMGVDPSRPAVSLNIITWDLMSKTHRNTSLEVELELDSIRDGREGRLEWVLGYDSTHMIEPGVSTHICVTEIGISLYQAQDVEMSLNVCKVSEIDIRKNKIVSLQYVRLAGTQPNWRFEAESLLVLRRDVIIIPQQEFGTNWRYHAKLASADCWIYSVKTQDPIYSPPLLRHDGLCTAPVPLSSSTYGFLTNTSKGIRIKFTTWEHDQQTLREGFPEISENDELLQLEHEIAFSNNLRDYYYSLLTCLLAPPPRRARYGNNRFFIIATSGKIEVYCFDKNFVLPNEDLTYCREREEKAEARKAKKLNSLHALDGIKGYPDRLPCP